MNDLIYLAPLLALTDSTFRKVYLKYFSGIDRALAPFIVVSENCRFTKKAVKSLFPDFHEAVPVEPQILAKDPSAFVSLATTLSSIGFRSVNINMGCPAPAVYSKGRGSGFLPHPERIREFLEICLEQLTIPLSVKIRTGLYSHNEIYPIIDVLNDFPLKEVIIHPRLGKDKYEGEVNLEIMDKIIPLIKHPLVYNGDIMRNSFARIKMRFPYINRWMCGRAVLQDPFLAADIKEYLNNDSLDLSARDPMDDKRKEVIKKFHDELLISYSLFFPKEAALVGKMKSYWYYLESLFPLHSLEIKEMRKILKLDDYRKSVDNIFM